MASDRPNARPPAAPLPPSTAWEERPEPGEELLFREFADHIKERQARLLRDEPGTRPSPGGRRSRRR